ncbi:protein of unknown function [Taphrina deformans PYCC 5710]|uniref:Uncharacterized protein n=1 Tax=Taphrina deformans (strain PYCC 5710 / ATCC 11124 / CBS 356.35 / IMI 108563 / JCM 9778 / NBRC 8474) TaxID=1097556 RepID=R4XDR1_TAPDE|nr:protein of unknown function [Taphrina deformans PYCC 5710]|eukprot:CCG83970.1 protein of unknown function [Taphrina deformans PYCC 5710]
MQIKDLRDPTNERLFNIEFLRKALDGNAPWLDTIVLSRQELVTTFAKGEPLKRRSRIYIVLGLSLARILEKKQLQLMDFVYAITLVTQELETFSNKEVLPKTTGPTSTKKEKTKKSLFSKIGDEFSLLHVPHFAFAPDYYQSLYTLLDILYEVHLKIMFYCDNPTSAVKDLSASVLDSFNKFSTRIRKLLNAVHQDIDTLARAKINRELNRVMFSLIPDSGAKDRQMKAAASSSFGYSNVTFRSGFANG